MSAVLDDVSRLRSVGGPPAGDVGGVALPFTEVDLSNLANAVIEPQDWYWDGYLPAGHVTLLAGHGGTGKSTIALMLAASIAVGGDFFGRRTLPARVLFFSGEDQGKLVRGRLAKICSLMALDYERVRQNLVVLDATDGDPILFTKSLAGGIRHGHPTPTYDELSERVTAQQIDVLIVDNASEVFDGDEIDRASVRAFIRGLAQIVRGRDGAVLLLAHVDKATSKGGDRYKPTEAYSGSTAWHNSVRSRLALIETKPGRLELLHQKSNLGRRHAPLALRWPDEGLPEVVADVGEPTGTESGTGGADATNTRVLLEMIHEFRGRGESVATAHNSPKTAAKLFEKEPTYPRGLRSKDATDLLRRAERAGLVARESYRGPDRKPHERWALTPAGCEHIGVAPGAPSAPGAELGTDGAGNAALVRQVREVRAGGCGGRARTQKSAQKRSKPPRKKTASRAKT